MAVRRTEICTVRFEVLGELEELDELDELEELGG